MTPGPWARFRRLHVGWQITAWVLVTPLPVAVWAFSQPKGERRYAAAMAFLVAAAWLTLLPDTYARDQHRTATSTEQPASTPTSTTGEPTSATSGSVSTPTTAATTVPSATTTAAPSATSTTSTLVTAPPPASLVDLLIVEPEGSGAGYDRDLFEHWVDDDHDGCDTRREVLIRQSLKPVTPGPGCTVAAGSGWWVSMYDNYSTDDPGEFDVDHVVALSEAWQSGAATWTADQRRSFANDLDNPQLIAVTAATNRSKSDRDPASWQPPNRDAWCTFATAWVTVKVAWHLTADAAEVKALRNMLVGC